VSDNWQGGAKNLSSADDDGRSAVIEPPGRFRGNADLVQPTGRTAERTSRLGQKWWSLEGGCQAEVASQGCHGRLPNKPLQRPKARRDLSRGDRVSRRHGCAVAPRDPWYDRPSCSRRPSPLNARAVRQTGNKSMRMLRSVRASVWVVVGVITSGSLARGNGAAGRARPEPAPVEVEGKLLEYQEKHAWCTYKPGAAAHSMGKSPWARFEVTTSSHAGRSFGVLLKCGAREDLLRALRAGTGRRFVLVLPKDFLQGKYSEIEDCFIESAAMKRWRPVGVDSESR
jgi:hypothetical protein